MKTYKRGYNFSSFLTMTLMGLLYIYVFFNKEYYACAIIIALFVVSIDLFVFFYSRSLNYLDITELNDLPLITKIYKDKIYDMFNKQADEVFIKWYYEIDLIKNVYEKSFESYCNFIANILINGIGKLNNCYDLQRLILKVNFYNSFVNQEVYDYYLKNLNTELLQTYSLQLQNFFTEEELIEYSYRGYPLNYSKITDNNLKAKLIFLKEIV